MFTLYAVDVVTGDIRDTVPFGRFTYSEERNGIGSFDFDTNAYDPRATRQNLDPIRTAVYLLDDADRVLFGGIVYTPSGDLTQTRCNGQGILAYYNNGETGRTAHVGLTVGGESFDVAEAIFERAHTPAGGNPFGLTIRRHPAHPGDAVLTQHHAYERKNVLDWFGEVADGNFEWTVAYEWRAGRIAHYLDLWAPRRGIELGMTVDLEASGITLGSWSLDGTRYANDVEAIGNGSGDDVLIGDYQTTPATYPLVEAQVSYRDELDEDTLARLARQEHRRRAELPYTFDATITDPDVLRPGGFAPGDLVYVTGPLAAFASLDQWCRIEGHSTTVTGDGHIELALQLATAIVDGPPILPMPRWDAADARAFRRRLRTIERIAATA